ncbi:MAG: dihydroorotate dehydrogenase electron transfer subunit [Candidatus Omnitrophota bacterium]
MKIEIQNNFFLKGHYHLLELVLPAAFKKACAGQFVHIRVEESSDPLLRRPLSIHEVSYAGSGKKGIMKVLYGAVGKGTRLLTEKKKGVFVDCLGPLGNGFDLKKIKRAKNIFIVAGGIGVAPLFFLVKTLAQQRSRINLAVLIGAKTKADILREKDFRSLGCKVYVATEDGSRGFKGRVTELLIKKLKDVIGSSYVCACGPKPMLASIAAISDRHEIPAQVSLEEFMGCGVGACLGCVIKTKNGYKRICHDGPVFDAQEIEWEQ